MSTPSPKLVRAAKRKPLKPVVMWAVVHENAKSLPRGQSFYWSSRLVAEAEAKYTRPGLRVIEVRITPA